MKLNGAPQFYFCEVGWSWSPRPLEDYDLWFVASGRGTMRCNNEDFALKSGTCFVWRPDDAPLGAQDEKHRLVVFAGHFEPLNAPHGFDFPFSFQVRDTAWFGTLAHRVEALWRRGDEDARLQATQLFGHLLWHLRDKALHPHSMADAAFLELQTAIRRAPARAWSLDEMACDLHLSRAQFVRRFRAIVGTSPAQFVSDIRLERARQLLGETAMTQAQIAHALGFCDAAHFSRAFARRYGSAPGALRAPETQRERG